VSEQSRGVRKRPEHTVVLRQALTLPKCRLLHMTSPMKVGNERITCFVSSSADDDRKAVHPNHPDSEAKRRIMRV
jgi:hypothetical protein